MKCQLQKDPCYKSTVDGVRKTTTVYELLHVHAWYSPKYTGATP